MIDFNNTTISIIIPIYNEEQIIAELYKRLHDAALEISPHYELIFINDGSRDNSLAELIKLTQLDPRVFYINFSLYPKHQRIKLHFVTHSQYQNIDVFLS